MVNVQQKSDTPSPASEPRLNRDTLLEDLIRLSSDWIWETDKDLCLTYTSDKILEKCDIAPQEVLGKNIFDVGTAKLPPHQKGSMPPQVRMCRPIENLEFIITAKDKSEQLFLLSALPLFDPETEKFIGYRGIGRDITTLKQHENQLVEKKTEAEKANSMKSMFLARVSHELRTPLNSIIGFSEILKGETFGPLGNPQYNEYTQDILESARHLLKVINNILDMSKAEAGKMELEEEKVLIEETLLSSLRFIAEQAKARDLDIEEDINLKDIYMSVDPAKIRQILLNLLGNALKFTPEGGRIRLTGQRTLEGDIEISVEDTGVGISAEDLPIALESFGQVDNKLSRHHEGTGLGLPLAQALTKLHGGTFTIDSQPAEGTRVTITLPKERVV